MIPHFSHWSRFSWRRWSGIWWEEMAAAPFNPPKVLSASLTSKFTLTLLTWRPFIINGRPRGDLLYCNGCSWRNLSHGCPFCNPHLCRRHLLHQLCTVKAEHMAESMCNVLPPEHMVCVHLSQVLENTELAYYVTVNHSVADGHFDWTIHLCRSNKMTNMCRWTSQFTFLEVFL